jgi:hypothetical protein
VSYTFAGVLDHWVTGLEFLGITKQLGCGVQGCAYATDHGTVVKVSDSLQELRVARAFQKLKHRIVPVIYGTGELPSRWPVSMGRRPTTIWIEREPLNDLNLSDAAEAMFTGGPLAYLLNNTAMNPTWDAKRRVMLPKSPPVRFPPELPSRDRKLLAQLMVGFEWLKAHNVKLWDHTQSANWGLREDGSVVVRDLGAISVGVMT